VSGNGGNANNDKPRKQRSGPSSRFTRLHPWNASLKFGKSEHHMYITLKLANPDAELPVPKGELTVIHDSGVSPQLSAKDAVTFLRNMPRDRVVVSFGVDGENGEVFGWTMGSSRKETWLNTGQPYKKQVETVGIQLNRVALGLGLSPEVRSEMFAGIPQLEEEMPTAEEAEEMIEAEKTKKGKKK